MQNQTPQTVKGSFSELKKELAEWAGKNPDKANQYSSTKGKGYDKFNTGPVAQ